MIRYITRSRKVNGLEINYEDHQVLLIDDAIFNKTDLAPKVIEIVGTFIHQLCATGLRDQLQEALQHGLNYNRPKDAILSKEEWDETVANAHEAMDNMTDLMQRRLADSFGDDRPHKALDGLEEDSRAVYPKVDHT